MSRFLVIKEQSCPGCDGQKVKKLRRYVCRKHNRYLDQREDTEDARLPERVLTCPECSSKAEAVIWDVACTCQGAGPVTTQVGLVEALADPAMKVAILAAVRPILARLLDMPETAISINGADQSAAIHAKSPGTR